MQPVRNAYKFFLQTLRHHDNRPRSFASRRSLNNLSMGGCFMWYDEHMRNVSPSMSFDPLAKSRHCATFLGLAGGSIDIERVDTI